MRQGACRQRAPVPVLPIPVPLAEGSVTLAMIEALIPLGLVERGFAGADGLLVVLDGAKGLHAAVREVFGAEVPVQRCQWHKRENVVR